MIRAPRRQEHWCPLPWVAVETTPNGESRVCCLSNTLITKDDGTPFNMMTDTLSEAFRSKNNISFYFRPFSKFFEEGFY